MSNSLVTPLPIACQAPLCPWDSFPRQEHWSGLPFPSPGNLPHPGIKPTSPTSQVDSLPLSQNLYMLEFMLQSRETENESDEPNDSRGRPGEGEDKRLMRMTKCRPGQGRLKRTRLLSWKGLGEEFQAEGPEGWTCIRVGLLECSGEPQPRARGTQGSESCLGDSRRESTCHQTGLYREAESMWLRCGGLSGASYSCHPGNQILVPTFAPLCSGREKFGRLGRGRPWLKPLTRAKPIVNLLIHFLFLFLII